MSDLIEREDILNVLNLSLDSGYINVSELLSYVKNLPSVEPKRKKGEWKIAGFLTRRCSECGAQIHELEYNNFCPHCGVDMRDNQ